MLKINKIYNMDCLEGMKKLPDNSVDLLVTDPPYGYSFMGKSWDRGVPSVEIWKECLRVLKHGTFAFIMSAPRQDVQAQMVFNLKEAGFELKFTPMYWTYATGFPKAMNIGKIVDKRLGAKRQIKAKARGHVGEKVKKHKGIYDDDNYEWKGVYNITIPSTPQAKALDGSYGGFQPKPAVEIILVAMKPLSEKTFVDQALKNGKFIISLIYLSYFIIYKFFCSLVNVSKFIRVVFYHKFSIRFFYLFLGRIIGDFQKIIVPVFIRSFIR